MRIGIITFWSSNDNYGQLLQCWALQQVLRDMGHEPFLIKFAKKEAAKAPLWNRVVKVLAIYPVIIKACNIKKRCVDAKSKQLMDERNVFRDFDGFRAQYIVGTPQVYSRIDELQENPPQADAYITGSDQVWAQLLSDKNNEAYFLNFGSDDTKRISYAPSFSMQHYPKKLLPKLRQCLSCFDAISVREKAGQRICKGLGFDATLVCDPTLLLPMESYQCIASNKRKDDKPYIYIYCINVEKQEELRWKELSKYAKSENMFVKATPSSGYIYGREIFGDETEYEYCSIPDWLKNISGAKLVVTPSFHGVVFSIIMHTPFVYVPLKGRFSGGNSRIEDLLERLELTDRTLLPNDNFKETSERLIDWEKTDALMKEYKEESLRFIKVSIRRD